MHKTQGDGRLTPLPLLEQVLWYARTVILSDDSRAKLLGKDVDEDASIIDSPAELQTLIVPRLHRIILNTIAKDVQQNGIINSMVGFPRVAIVMSYLKSMNTDSLEAICLAAGISETIPHATHQKLAEANKWLLDQFYRDLLEKFLIDLYDRGLGTKKTDDGASPWEAVSLFERLDGLSPTDLGVFLRDSKSKLLARKAAKRKKRADAKRVEEEQRVQGLNPLGDHRPIPPSNASGGDGKPAAPKELTFCTNALLEKIDLNPLQRARASSNLAGVPTAMSSVADIEQMAEALRVLQQQKDDMAKLVTEADGIMGLPPSLVKQIVSGKVDDVKASKSASLPFQGEYRSGLEQQVYTIRRDRGLNVFDKDVEHLMRMQWDRLNLNDFLPYSGPVTTSAGVPTKVKNDVHEPENFNKLKDSLANLQIVASFVCGSDYVGDQIGYLTQVMEGLFTGGGSFGTAYELFRLLLIDFSQNWKYWDSATYPQMHKHSISTANFMQMAGHQASINNPTKYHKTWDAPPEPYVDDDANNLSAIVKQAVAAAFGAKSGGGKNGGGGAKNGGNSGRGRGGGGNGGGGGGGSGGGGKNGRGGGGRGRGGRGNGSPDHGVDFTAPGSQNNAWYLKRFKEYVSSRRDKSQNGGKGKVCSRQNNCTNFKRDGTCHFYHKRYSDCTGLLATETKSIKWLIDRLR